MDMYDAGDVLTAEQNQGSMDVPFPFTIQRALYAQADDPFCQQIGVNERGGGCIFSET